MCGILTNRFKIITPQVGKFLTYMKALYKDLNITYQSFVNDDGEEKKDGGGPK